MKNTGTLTRWLRLSAKQRMLLAEAALSVAVASAAVRLLPFKRAVLLGSRRLSGVRSRDSADQVRWAVEAAARYVPWRAVCFQQGLALQWMLRRRGVDALLHYGIGRDDCGYLEAHVWVGVDGDVVIGGTEAARFKRVATFP